MLSAREPADWLDHSHVPLLRTLATAVVRLADTEALQSFSLPYDPEAQRALDRVVLACLRERIDPPTSLPDLLRWCRTRPLEDWPLDLPSDAFGPEDFLVDRNSGKPTQLCHEWWAQGRDTAASQYDRMVVHRAMRLCQDACQPQSYSAFRRLLVERPVLTSHDQFELATDLYLEPVRTLLDDIYEPAPAAYRRDGVYTSCGRCLTLLTPLVDGGWWCERDQCRSRGPAPHGRVLDPGEVGEVCQLARPLRQFVTGPGRAEVELEQRLHALHLPVEMWPGFDAYDLRITFPDGYVWAVDVKDWAHPGLLGRKAAPVRSEPGYDEACWVVPDYRVRARPDYLEVFAGNRTTHAAGLRLLTDRQLVQAAQARLRGDRSARARIGPARGADEPFDGDSAAGAPGGPNA
ncbi:pPIWI_RE_Y domain-containing protein [Kitasatospora sp. NPDC004289]